MKRILRDLSFLFFALLAAASANAQLEWRLANATFNPADPDAGGPAKGTVTFTLQIRSVAGTVPNITGMSTGWSWQSANAMLPTGPAPAPTCGTNSVAPPSNVVVSPTLAALGFTFNNVNQCSGSVNFVAGGQTFDRRAVGSFDGGSIDLTTTWVDVFTVTLWALNNDNGGKVVINSGNGAAAGPFSTYAVADVDANEFVVTSLTYGTPLALTATEAPLPVQFTRFGAQCSDNGTTVSWSTASERDNAYFEVQKSADGNNWSSLGRVNSNSSRTYEFFDKTGGQAIYRVKQVDLNGTFTYTTLVRTTCGSQSFFVNLFPVPAKNRLTLVVGSDRTVRTMVRVLDNSGRVVMTTQLNIAKGTNNFTLDVNHLAQGQYFIRGGEQGLEINQRFTITR